MILPCGQEGHNIYLYLVQRMGYDGLVSPPKHYAWCPLHTSNNCLPDSEPQLLSTSLPAAAGPAGLPCHSRSLFLMTHLV